jgi:uncharacterized membrane protein YhaH (DUF805 family)
MDLQAIFENFRRTITDHYFDMSGRAGRAQFWYYILAYIVIAIGVAIVQGIIFAPLLALFNLALLLPSASLGARRLQDIGRDGKLIWIFIALSVVSQLVSLLTMMSMFAIGWLSFVLFGPLAVVLNVTLFVVFVVLIYWWCQPGDSGSNAYGPPPPTFDPSVKPAA